jgi:hypothetical protein
VPRGDFVLDRIGNGADQIRRHLDGIHFLQERTNVTYRQAAGIQRENLVVEAGETALMLRNQHRRKGAVPIPRNHERQRAVVGQDGLRTRAIAMIGRSGRRRGVGLLREVMAELGAQGPLEQGLLKPPGRRFDIRGRQHALGRKLIQNRVGHGG